MARVAVVGGGITGLAAAFELSRGSGTDVIVFEATERLGGKLQTSPFDGLPAVDEAADAFLARVPWAVELCHELGLDDDLVAPATGRAYVWWGGELHAIPPGLVLGVPAGLGGLARSHLLSWPGKARAAIEPLVPRGRPAPDELGALIRHRFGSEVLERLVDPLVGSINAGDASRLSLAVTAPQVAESARRSRSLLLSLGRGHPAPDAGPVFLAPRGGMQVLVDRLAEGLGRADIRLGHAIQAIERDGRGWRVDGEQVDGVIVAAPAPAASKALASTSPRAAQTLAHVDYASVAIVTLSFHALAPGRPLDGSGHLVPKPVQRCVTAVSWASTKWEHWSRPGRVVLRASVGRWGAEHLLDLDDARLVEAVLDDLQGQLGIREPPLAVRVSRWPHSFPQYAPGHLDRMRAMDADLAFDAPGVVMVGAACRGLGIPACIRQGREGAVATMRLVAP